jgi:hypothetical protein
MAFVGTVGLLKSVSYVSFRFRIMPKRIVACSLTLTITLIEGFSCFHWAWIGFFMYCIHVFNLCTVFLFLCWVVEGEDVHSGTVI